MYKTPPIRTGFVPRSNPSFTSSKIILQPNKHGRWTSRISPWTTSTHPIDYKSESLAKGIKNSDNSYNQSSLDLMNENIIDRKGFEERRKTPKNISSKETKYPFRLLSALLTLFSMISLVALAMAIYTILFVQAAFKTTTSTSTTTTTTTFSFRWNMSGTTVAGVTGSFGNTAVQLNLPFGLTMDTSKTLYIAEWQGNRVTKWPVGYTGGTTVAGQASGTAGAGLNALNSAGDVVIDDSGNCYVADAVNHRVQFWSVGSLSGTTVAGISGSGGALLTQLNTPYSLARDPIINALYIADTGNHRVMRYFSGASSGTIVAGGNSFGVGSTQLYSPTGIYFDAPSNSLIIVNYLANNVVRWVLGATSWIPLVGSPIGTAGTSSSLLNMPIDVTLDPMGNIYVADTFNNRVQFFFAGQVNGTTVAGTSTGAGSTQLSSPYSVLLDSDLNLYVSDAGNHRVQRYNRY